jgi:hypothetical protein
MTERSEGIISTGVVRRPGAERLTGDPDHRGGQTRLLTGSGRQ